ncbi:DUF6545 domain-containing protein [Streptomyces sp. NPDC037389]|uniref:DUF6545 domain-containing protein n=1 Tax=Streptomyces sp. NPDC037389 TaxID=3155369 RepID=UPI0033C98FCD
MLVLTVVCGLPVEATVPYRRVLLTTPGPAADAVGEGRLVWVGCQEGMARRYPRVAAYFPYRLGVANAPLKAGRHCWGTLGLVWPADHSSRLGLRERERITGAARRIYRGRQLPPSRPNDRTERRVALFAHFPRLCLIYLASAVSVMSGLFIVGEQDRFAPQLYALHLFGYVTYLGITVGEFLVQAWPLGQLARKRWETRSFKALAPLWSELVEVGPDIDPAATAAGEVAEDDGDVFLHRRVIEINDGILTLRSYRSGRVQQATRHTLARLGEAARYVGMPPWKRLCSKTLSGPGAVA